MSDERFRPLLKQGDFFAEAQSLEDGAIDFIFVDPPYFLSNDGFSVSSGKAVSVNKGAWDTSASDLAKSEFHRAWVRESARLLAENGSIVVSGTYHSIFDCGVLLKAAGFEILNDIIWFKPNGAPNLSGRRVTASHETLIWAAKSGSSKFVYNYSEMRAAEFEEDKIKTKGKQLRSVWWIPNVPKSEKQHGPHPTQKPLRLMRRVIQAFTLPGQTVLDPFMGSGTTGVAALGLGRNFIGFEKEADYFDLAKKRMAVLK